MYKCIHRHPAVSGPVSLMYCSFSYTYLGFPRPHHEHSEPHEAFYCTQSEEGQIELIKNPTESLCPWTVTEDGPFFLIKHGYQVCILPHRTSRMLNVCTLLFCPSPSLNLNAFWRTLPSVMTLKMQQFPSTIFFFFSKRNVNVILVSLTKGCISLFFMEHKYSIWY